MAARCRFSESLPSPTLAADEVRMYATASTRFLLLAIDLAPICQSFSRKTYKKPEGMSTKKEPEEPPDANKSTIPPANQPSRSCGEGDRRPRTRGSPARSSDP